MGPPVAFRDWVGVYDRASGTVGVAVDPTQLLVEVAAPQFLDGGFLSTSQTILTGGTTTATARITPFGGCAGSSLVAGGGHWCVQTATSGNALVLHAPDAGMTDVVLDTELTIDGANPTAPPSSPAFSSTGRFVAFVSAATNHVAGDANGLADVFVVDRDPDADGVFDEGTSLPVQRVSVAPGTGAIDPNGASSSPALSADGRYVVFTSAASNLVAGDTNGATDVFRYDRTTGTTERVSVANGGGAQANGGSFAPATRRRCAHHRLPVGRGQPGGRRHQRPGRRVPQVVRHELRRRRGGGHALRPAPRSVRTTKGDLPSRDR